MLRDACCVKRDLLLGALVNAREGRLDGGEFFVDRGAEVLDFFRQCQETGVDLVADGGQLRVQFGAGDEIGRRRGRDTPISANLF